MSDFFGWGDEVTSDGDIYVTLMPGKYVGEITSAKKGMWESKGKMNGCKYVDVSVTIKTDDGQTTVSDNIFLSRSVEWKIGQFLRACGLKAKGEPIKPEKASQSVHKKVLVTIGCQLGKDHDYQDLTDPNEIQSYLNSGVDVYNRIKKYEVYEPSPASTDNFSVSEEISDDEFGF